jgi:hypothetical protein
MTQTDIQVKDVENDLREVKVKRWRQEVNSKEELASDVKKAKVIRQPRSKYKT